MDRRLAAILCAVALVTGCTPSAEVDTATPSATGSPEPTSITPSVDPSLSPSPSPSPTGAALPGAELPVRGEEVGIELEPVAGGFVYASMNSPNGAVIVRFDSTGQASPGWPVLVPDSTYCWFPGAAADGSARAICDATDITQPDWCCDTVRAYALGVDGRVTHGWPVEIDETAAARMIGNDLVVVSDLPVTDVEAWGAVTKKAHVTRITADGSLTRGIDVPIVYRGGSEAWAIGPDGVAYARSYVASTPDQDPPFTTTEILAIDHAGSVDGWPLDLGGIATTMGFASDGRVLVSVGEWDKPPVRIVAVDPGGRVSASSPALPTSGPSSGLDCGAHELLAGDQTYVFGGDMRGFYALDPGMAIIPGWPYEAPRSLQQMGFESLAPEVVDCAFSPAGPALGPEGTLYLPLSPASDRVGGELVAIGRDGTMVPGWPVALRRAEAGFWQVAVGPDRAVYAVAAELEGDDVSRTLLAISPDSTVRWRALLVEP